MKAHPTQYAITRFRSRLEAKWAAFFDLCGWCWEYEPPDEHGWVPDFLLIGASSVLKVEVKPITWTGDTDQMMALVKTAPELEKVRRYAIASEKLRRDDASSAGFESTEEVRQYIEGLPEPKGHWPRLLGEDILVLGAYPHRPYFSKCRHFEAHFGMPLLGVYAIEAGGGIGTNAAMLIKYSNALDFRAAGRCCGSMSGRHDEKLHGMYFADCWEEVQALWREAGNRVMWRPPSYE